MGVLLRAAPDTWITHNAWKKGYSTWRTQQNEFQDGEGSRLKGKWADFKVGLDDSGDAKVTPVDGNASGGDAYLTGDWELSNFVYDDAGTSRSPSIHLIGSTVYDDSIGLIQEYGDARNYPGAEPDNIGTLATGFYAQFHGVGDIDDELGADIRDQNDIPPYDQDQYPGGHDNGDHPIVLDIGATTGEFPVVKFGSFALPCGLLNINQASGGAASFLITVAAGSYKGVLATPMGHDTFDMISFEIL